MIIVNIEVVRIAMLVVIEANVSIIGLPKATVISIIKLPEIAIVNVTVKVKIEKNPNSKDFSNQIEMNFNIIKHCVKKILT